MYELTETVLLTDDRELMMGRTRGAMGLWIWTRGGWGAAVTEYCVNYCGTPPNGTVSKCKITRNHFRIKDGRGAETPHLTG